MSNVFDLANLEEYGAVVNKQFVYNGTSVSVGTGTTTLLTFDAIDKNDDTDIMLDFYAPVRNNTGNWGGMYLYFYYTENPDDPSPTWTYIGGTGYSSSIMSYNFGRIGSYKWNCVLTGLTTKRFQFRVDGRSYNSTLYINGWNAVSGGSDGIAHFKSHIIATELRK